MSMDITIWLRDVWKTYVDGERVVTALKGVNLSVKRGEIVGIQGPSGSGKSTLLKIIAGIERPDRGDVIVEGYNLNMLDENGLAMLRNTVVGYIPQDLGLIEELTIYENIELPLLIAGMPRNERRARVLSVMEYIGLKGKEKAKPSRLSGGERQRVAIARALVNTPTIILADEPTANLDWSNAVKVLELFRKIRDDFNTTIIIVSHDPRVMKYTDRSLLMCDGFLSENKLLE
ncbi:MAG TPA: ABC transporter ATP-binding protein [Desulfurococcales archaeon]|nr:ABC transporter ATP-binding protein [Desulfurococcales archaeon]